MQNEPILPEEVPEPEQTPPPFDRRATGSSLDQGIRALKLALSFLTVIPIRFSRDEVSEADLAASRYAYPLAGGAFGLVLAGLSWGLSRIGAGPEVTAFFLIASGVTLSGGLHLDGLADTADGLFLPGDWTRRLAVLRDPRVGSFGVIALILVLLGKYAALSAMVGPGRSWAVLCASVVGRSLVLVSAGLAGYARPEGTGRILVEATTFRDAMGGLVIVLIVGATCRGMQGVLASALALGFCFLLTRLARQRLGGLTGDILGAVVETGELIFLLSLI
ncbi:MAG: adenosylcobinamide-GDP ribazoletransferase [Isosphaeraceae bacterium]